MEDVEEEAIRAVLEEVGGNRRKAAERLEIGERTLYRKIKKFGLEDEPSDPPGNRGRELPPAASGPHLGPLGFQDGAI